MKKPTVLFYGFMLFGFQLLICLPEACAQEKTNLTVGTGFPELINLGFRYQHKQTQAGIGFGFVPVSGESVISVSADGYYHFAGHTSLSQRRPWYGRTGLNYIRDEKPEFTDQFLYLSLRIGKDLNITEKLGVALDAGPMFQLYHKETTTEPATGDNSGWSFPVLPAFGISLFYRFLPKL
jgi:hypothetical protein